jgi:hypothetical protein
MGMHAARCMFAKYEHDQKAGKEIPGKPLVRSDVYADVGSDTIFDVFTHVTRFFNYKVRVCYD